MQPMKYLLNFLDNNAKENYYLFTLKDFRALFPYLNDNTFKTLLSRTVKAGYLTRICRNIYIFNKNMAQNGLILYHIAALLRADQFNYISLENILSEYGIISQIPINHLSIMSSGRSNIISCDQFGVIEFIHTNKKPSSILKQLSYDKKYKLWRASPKLAFQDMKSTHRNLDLINMEILHEFI
jgi:predicted transcriptional regulator of viral defense system